jgi:deazaflavin-dependent oxidoreductase (nitroreductase family)
LTHALDPLRRSFDVLNRWFALPALRAGLGPLFSTPVAGSLLILRTTGRTSGLPREAPLGYVIREGAVYVCAGFGRRTAWYRNLVADPHVEVVLPAVAFSGVAETVTDRAEWDRIYPAYIRALGVVGRLTLGDLRTVQPERLEAIRASLPLVRIRPTGLASGPSDPGGLLWVVVQGAMLVILVRLLLRGGRRLRASVGPSPDR